MIAPANPLRSLEGDAAYVASILAQEQGPFVVVGHSYGGAVISNATAGNEDVEALVYIAGFIPDVGEDTLHLAGAGSLVPESIEFKGFPPFGANDVVAVEGRPWKTIPSWSLIPRQDRTITPEQQRFMSARERATVVEVDASHVAMISKPGATTKLILDAAHHGSR